MEGSLDCSAPGRPAEGWMAASWQGLRRPGTVRQPLSSFTPSESFYSQSCFKISTRHLTDV